MATNKYANASKVALIVALVTMLSTTHFVKAKISCELVIVLLAPCVVYGVFGGKVPPECCEGIKKSLALVKTPQDLRDKCKCVQKGAAGIPGLNYTRVNELPAKCGTTSPYIVSPKTNCSRLG